MVTFGNVSFLFAICSRSEKPIIFFRRVNQKATGDQKYTRLQISLKDGEALMGEFARLLKEMEETEDGDTIPTLAKREDEYLCDDHKSDDFWDPVVTWVSESGMIRCRPIENQNNEFSIVINQPRKEDQQSYAGYLGPTLFLPRGGARMFMNRINTNLKRYSANTD